MCTQRQTGNAAGLAHLHPLWASGEISFLFCGIHNHSIQGRIPSVLVPQSADIASKFPLNLCMVWATSPVPHKTQGWVNQIQEDISILSLGLNYWKVLKLEESFFIWVPEWKNKLKVSFQETLQIQAMRKDPLGWYLEKLISVLTQVPQRLKTCYNLP